jgi:hypothetical protein
MAGFLIIHYGSAALILFTPASKYADLEYLMTMPRTSMTLFFAGVVWYLGGQVFLWIIALKNVPAAKPASLAE